MIDLHHLATMLPAGSRVTIEGGLPDLLAHGAPLLVDDARTPRCMQMYEHAHVAINGVRFSAGRFRPLSQREIAALLKGAAGEVREDPHAEGIADDARLEREHAA